MDEATFEAKRFAAVYLQEFVRYFTFLTLFATPATLATIFFEEGQMPKFLDQHVGGLTPEMVGMVKQKVQAGQVDQFGAKALNVFWSGSETFCLSEAPSAEAVHKGHEAIGIKLAGGNIRQVDSVA